MSKKLQVLADPTLVIFLEIKIFSFPKKLQVSDQPTLVIFLTFFEKIYKCWIKCKLFKCWISPNFLSPNGQGYSPHDKSLILFLDRYTETDSFIMLKVRYQAEFWTN